MITPRFVLDSRERWFPVSVESIVDVGATVNGFPIDLSNLPPMGGRFDFPRDMVQPKSAPLAGYHRVVFAGSLWWHQFWTWWLYNPKKYVGFGAHEGDWEMVQLGCIDEEGEFPVLMTCSQHDGGEKREYWRTELDRDLPKVYVARDSHANYFATNEDVTDQADGKGALLATIEWRDFGPWAEWKGKWGNSDNSPGPLSTRRAWQAPHAYHSQARG
jgi:hypothetical protein